MRKLFLIYLVTITLQVFGQTSGKNSGKLIGKWLLKDHVVSEKSFDDSLRIELELKETGVFTTRYTHLYKNPNYANKASVTSGKWKLDSTQKQIHLYNIWQESPSPHQIPNKDLEIIELTKKIVVVNEELTPNTKGKSTYVRQKN